jgi:hypothetical protein
MPERNLAIRLSVMEGGKVKAELKEIGESGEKSLKKIELAGLPASKSLLALNAAANDVRGSAIGLTSHIGPLGSAMTALGPAGIVAGAGLGAMVIMLKKSFEEAALAEQAQNRLLGVLRATGYASGLTGKDLAEMAEEMEHSTLTSAESVKNAAAILATFRSVSGDTFKQAIHLAQDIRHGKRHISLMIYIFATGQGRPTMIFWATFASIRCFQPPQDHPRNLRPSETRQTIRMFPMRRRMQIRHTTMPTPPDIWMLLPSGICRFLGLLFLAFR